MKFIKILLVLSVVFLNAQVLKITKDWNLFGAVASIDSVTPFANECVKSLFVYKNGAWISYAKGEIQSIAKGIGFWVYASKDCDITLSNSIRATTSPQPTPEQIEQIKNKNKK